MHPMDLAVGDVKTSPSKRIIGGKKNPLWLQYYLWILPLGPTKTLGKCGEWGGTSFFWGNDTPQGLFGFLGKVSPLMRQANEKPWLDFKVLDF